MKFTKNKNFRSVIRTISQPLRRIWPRQSEAVLGLLALMIIVFCLTTFNTSIAHRTSQFLNQNRYLALVDGLFNPFRNRHILLKSGLPVYDLKIKHQQFTRLEEVVKKAKKQGWMSDDLKTWVNGQFIHEGQVYDVKVRIRGDLPAHWKGPKKSWRIKFGKQIIEDRGEIRKEPIYFQGKRQINLIIPIDREYILAYFINSILRDKSLVVPRDGFVILRINGIIQGLYYEVEHFDKPLLAYNKRPETTIFGQNDRAMHFEQYTKYGTPAVADARYDIGAMRRLVDEEGELAMQAMNVLINHSVNPTPENFRRAKAVLDWEKFQQFRVITTLCNTNHVRFGSDNLRLYYDSSRGLLEPVPWDVHLKRMPKEPGTIDFWNFHGLDELQRATLIDPQLRHQRNKMMWQLIGDGGDSLIAKYEKIHNRIRPLAWADVLYTPIQAHKMDLIKKDFEYNVRRVFKVLNNSSCNFTYRLVANDRAALEMFVNNFSGINLKQIFISDSLIIDGHYLLYEDVNYNGKLDKADALVTEQYAQYGTLRFDINKLMFPEFKHGVESINERHWEYFVPVGKRCRFFLVGKLTPEKRHPLLWNPPDMAVAAENAVSGHEIPSAFIDQDNPLPENYIGITAFDNSDVFNLDAIDLPLAEFVKKHPEFKVSKSQTGAVELRGKVTLDETVIVPRSVMLIIQPGADITLKPDVSLLCYGGLTSAGTAEHPISIHGDGSGEPFGVVAAVRPPKKVEVSYTRFRDGGQAQINGILFTGGFAVHEGDLDLIQSQFTNMQSEDGVNLKNGRLTMKNCLFANNASDGIDLDFSEGEVIGNKFVNNVGDGLDLSGTKLTIAHNWFEKMADKGVSVGEDSHPILINNLFRDCEIGISTKDLSLAKIAHCTFVNNKLAVEAKRKKPMFGPGSGEIVNSVFAGNQTILREDYFSRGRVRISHSVADESVEWPASKTTDVRFLAPQENNYLIDPVNLMGNGFSLAQPDWLKSNVNGKYIEQPGIYSIFE